MTQTRKDALQELLAKVKGGIKYETMGHTRMCQRAFPKPDNFDGSRQAYAEAEAQRAVLAWRNGDMNAALALHNAVLPDAGWEVYRTSKYPGMIPGSSRHEFAAKVGWGTTHMGEADNPARAWLCAIMKALISECDE